MFIGSIKTFLGGKWAWSSAWSKLPIACRLFASEALKGGLDLEMDLDWGANYPNGSGKHEPLGLV